MFKNAEKPFGEVAPHLAIEYLPIPQLRQNSHNARTHSPHQVRQIAASIRRFGFTNPILIDGNNTIIAGHGRVQASAMLGLSSVPVIRRDDMTSDEVRAYVIADNRLAENAGWDKEILAIELQHLLELDVDLDATITGFEIAEIDLVIEDASHRSEPEDQIEPCPDLPLVSKVGDVWQLGRHSIACANALDQSSYDSVLRGKRASLIFTDPPYNVRIAGHVSRNDSISHREFLMASGEMSDDEFLKFLTQTCSLLAANSSDGSIHFVCMDWAHAGLLHRAGECAFNELKNICVWVKGNGGLGSLYRSQHELVFVFKNGTARHVNNVQLGKFGRNRTNVWNYPSPTGFGRARDEGNLAALHPTVKPVNLVADAILDCSERGDVVLDPFLGSGSTLIAAERVGRSCCGLELDPQYVDVAIRRWQQHTGDRAVHVESGLSFSELESTRSNA